MVFINIHNFVSFAQDLIIFLFGDRQQAEYFKVSKKLSKLFSYCQCLKRKTTSKLFYATKAFVMAISY